VLRWTAAICVFIATFAAAKYVHAMTERDSVGNTPGNEQTFPWEYQYHPWWSAPLAILIVCCGVALGVIILAQRRYSLSLRS
jgi:hypothetical protein